MSGFLGLGFTFFSGAVQAWLVDALRANGYHGGLEAVFARGEIVEGVAMLGGSVAGGLLAQFTNIGVPYVLRAAMLAISFVLAFRLMRDEGFTPQRSSSLTVVRRSVRYGLGAPAVRWVMLANFFTDGVSMYAFYAMQPFLLVLHGNPHAYWIAGLAAAVVGGAQIAGGVLAPRIARLARKRTTILLLSVMISSAVLLLIGLFPFFWVALVLLVIWGLVFATVAPVRQAYINDLIPSEQRATVLSFDSLVGSTGGAAVQPLLGRAADAWGYPASYACSAAIQACAIPLLWIAHRHAPPRDDAS